MKNKIVLCVLFKKMICILIFIWYLEHLIRKRKNAPTFPLTLLLNKIELVLILKLCLHSQVLVYSLMFFMVQHLLVKKKTSCEMSRKPFCYCN